MTDHAERLANALRRFTTINHLDLCTHPDDCPLAEGARASSWAYEDAGVVAELRATSDAYTLDPRTLSAGRLKAIREAPVDPGPFYGPAGPDTAWLTTDVGQARVITGDLDHITLPDGTRWEIPRSHDTNGETLP